MNKKSYERLSSKHLDKLEIYIKAFMAKFPQVIVQSRCGVKKQKSFKASENVFEIAIEENPDIQEKVKEACCNLNPLQDFCLCVETFLITADGDSLVLEAWNLCLTYSETFWDPKYRVYAGIDDVLANLRMLLKSTIAITRCTPAYKLSLSQSASTHVILYRIYPGEPQVQQLGLKPNVTKIGEVYTPAGTISVTVACRSKSEMTVAPQFTGKENSFMLKSDYFDSDMSPKRTFSGARTIKNRVLRNSTNSQNAGAFAECSMLPDQNFPELDFLQRNILHPSRSYLNQEQEKPVDNPKGDMNSNLASSPPKSPEAKLDRDTVCDRLSGSDVSDGCDFVFVDMKPPFANPADSELNAFFHECQCAPSLSSFSNPPSLQEQVQDLTNQLEKFEISMMDFDNFVDSVCQVNSET